MKLEGKEALITGANSGIGRAVAIAFAKEGADIAINDLYGGEKTVKGVSEQGRKALLVLGDIGKEKDVKRIIEKTVSEFKKIDILVNNAAVEHMAPIEEVSLDLWNRVLMTNITGVFLMTKCALPYMPDGGRIINTGSIEGLEGNGSDFPYSASKGAVHAFSKSLAKALVSRRITCNVVAPGPVATPMLKTESPELHKTRKAAKYPLGVPAPENIAPTYVFLASADADYYSGEVIAPTAGHVTAA